MISSEEKLAEARDASSLLHFPPSPRPQDWTMLQWNLCRLVRQQIDDFDTFRARLICGPACSTQSDMASAWACFAFPRNYPPPERACASSVCPQPICVSSITFPGAEYR